MYKLRKGDTAQVMKGKDKGKKGRVIEILTGNNKALVEGINTVKKHKRKTQQDQQGGIVTIELPIQIANLMVFCKTCNRGRRVGFSVLKDGSKIRICKSCKESI